MSIAINRSAPAEYSISQRAWLAVGAFVAFALLLMVAQSVWAGSVNSGSYNGTSLNDVWDLLRQFVEGPIGRIITLLIIVVGVAAGILTQSLGAFAVGVGAALGLSFAPKIINGLLGATLQASDVVATHAFPAAIQIAPLAGF